MIQLHGPIVALLTPFDASGKIEWQAFKAYLSSMYSWGVRTVITNGTTGEFPSMTIKERGQVVEFVRQNFAGVIINNVSSTSVSDTRKLIADAKDCADCILLLPPYYYSACRDEGFSRFFVDTLSGATLPAMLYHFPQHTGNHLGIDLVTTLFDQGLSIVGIKDSSGDIDNAQLYRINFPECAVFLGNDEKVFEALQKGLSGSVTGAANPMPELLIAMQTEYRLSASKAQSMQRCLDVWNRFRNDSGYFEIPLVKAAMGARIDSFPVHVRPPLTPVPVEVIDRTRKVIYNCLNDFNLLN